MTLQQLRRKIEQAGGELVNDGEGRFSLWNAVLPKGKTWKASGTHCLAISWMDGDSEDRQRALEDCADRVAYGVENCEQGAECDYCNAD